MQGVTIKNEIVEREIEKSTLIVVLVGVAISLVVAVAAAIKHILAENFGLVALVAVAAIVMVIYARDMWRMYNNTWTEYVVEIEDLVSLNEFNEKYEITNEEGDNTYQVKVRS